mgnify:CR=1 FL=1
MSVHGHLHCTREAQKVWHNWFKQSQDIQEPFFWALERTHLIGGTSEGGKKQLGRMTVANRVIQRRLVCKTSSVVSIKLITTD